MELVPNPEPFGIAARVEISIPDPNSFNCFSRLLYFYKENAG